MTGTGVETRRYRLFEIHDRPQPFRMVSEDPLDVAMTWLAEKEKQREGWLPRHIVWVRDLDATDDDNRGVVIWTPAALRRRDRERMRCGLPPYWEKIARQLELETSRRPAS